MASTTVSSFVFSVAAKGKGANPAVTTLVSTLRTSKVKIVGIIGFRVELRVAVVLLTPDAAKFRKAAKAKRMRFTEGTVPMWREPDAWTALAQLEQFSASGADMRVFGAFSDFKLSLRGKLSIGGGGFGFVEEPAG